MHACHALAVWWLRASLPWSRSLRGALSHRLQPSATPVHWTFGDTWAQRAYTRYGTKPYILVIFFSLSLYIVSQGAVPPCRAYMFSPPLLLCWLLVAVAGSSG